MNQFRTISQTFRFQTLIFSALEQKAQDESETETYQLVLLIDCQGALPDRGTQASGKEANNDICK